MGGRHGEIALFVGVLVALFAGGCGSSSEGSEAQATATEESATIEESSEEHFTRENWDILATDADSYKGASVDIVGKIFLPPERDADGVYFQMYADPKNSEYNTLVALADTALLVNEEDYVRVRGEVRGSYSGENAFGAELTLPVIDAASVKVVDATAASSPALLTYGKATLEQAGIRLMVRKVEFAADETRVFVTVRNDSAYKATFYGFDIKAIQGRRQYEPDTNFEYPEINSEILPGIVSSGVIAFPAMKAGGNLKLVFELSSENYEAGDYGTLTYTFTWR